MDQSAFPGSGTPLIVETPDVSPSNLALQTSQTDDGSIIDVMVVYTDDAASASGGGIDAKIQLAIDETNESYGNSDINHRLSLVHSQEVDYDETGDSSTDLDCIKDTSDGCLDQIHEWRDTHNADLVSLWVESIEGDNAETEGAFPYSFGYQDPGGNWRTIMDNTSGCCPKLQFWSNPDVTHDGVPMGVPEGEPDAADNRKTLNNTALTVANFGTFAATFSIDEHIVTDFHSDN